MSDSMYFSYDEACGFATHTTQQDAIECAHEALCDERDNADDGWSPDADNICWGVVLGGVVSTDPRPATEDDNLPAGSTVVDKSLNAKPTGLTPEMLNDEDRRFLQEFVSFGAYQDPTLPSLSAITWANRLLAPPSDTTSRNTEG